LTNLETSQQKLLQIVLAGQPEFDQKLDSHELRQLKQRIALRCHLEAFTLDETRQYMNRRLQIAGAAAENQIFSGATMEAVFRHSRGIPRLINTISENSLLAGYAKQAAAITPEIVDGVARDLRLTVAAPDPKSVDLKSNGGSHPSKISEKVSEREQKEQNELLLAVKTLLEVHDRMQRNESKGRLQ
jgi:general secretion pathway protein A